MKLKNYLYLTQLEEYDINRIETWLKNNPGHEVVEVKKTLIWTAKIKTLFLISNILFFLPPEKSVILGLRILSPFDVFLKYLLVTIAKVKLRLFYPNLKVICITGSWGKTTAKETLVSILSTKYRAASTLGNQNTLLGISLRVLRLAKNTEYFVCEAGAYYPGDIRDICNLVHPQIGIITAIGPMHLERFGSLANIQKTKMELAESLPSTGQLYLPKDQKNSINKFHLKVINIVYFDNLNTVYQDLVPNTKIPDVNTKHRLQIMQNNGITIIDDSYNSNPVGFSMALDKLKSLKSKNNILITPGMIELGSQQVPENARLIQLADSTCQHLILVGHTNRGAFKSVLTKPKSKVHYVENITEAQTLLPTITTPNSAVLIENDLPDNYL